MADRLDLQAIFEEILGSRNVYFQPPASVQMNYDCIRYELGGKDLIRADNKVYRMVNKYDGVVISRDPECTIPDTILMYFEMVDFGKPYVVDNLYHYPFTLYF